MTEEELNRLEALATDARDNAAFVMGEPVGAAHGKFLRAVDDPALILSLIRLARVGLAAEEMHRALSVIADGDGDPHEIALQTLSALPKPGDRT